MALREFHTDVDVKGRLLLGGSAGTTGQVPVSQGSGNPAIWGTAGSGGTYTVSATAPSSPAAGDRWFDTGTAAEYTYINDGDSSQWVETGTPGAIGPSGAAATVAVGTVTTGAAGSNATVTNSGTSTAATFNFTIPRGDTGATGATGPTGPKAVTISAPSGSEKLALFYTTAAITISQIRSVVSGTSPSVTFSIRYGSDFSAAGTEVVTSGITCTNTTTGLSTTSFNNASITANNFVWLTTSAISGTVTALNVTVVF